MRAHHPNLCMIPWTAHDTTSYHIFSVHSFATTIYPHAISKHAYIIIMLQLHLLWKLGQPLSGNVSCETFVDFLPHTPSMYGVGSIVYLRCTDLYLGGIVLKKIRPEPKNCVESSFRPCMFLLYDRTHGDGTTRRGHKYIPNMTDL